MKAKDIKNLAVMFGLVLGANAAYDYYKNNNGGNKFLGIF